MCDCVLAEILAIIQVHLKSVVVSVSTKVLYSACLKSVELSAPQNIVAKSVKFSTDQFFAPKK